MRHLAVTILMTASLFGVAATANGQGNGRNSPGDVETATLYETKKDIEAFSKRLDNALTHQEMLDATIDLSTLYLRVISDPRFQRSKVLQANRGRIATKLQQAAKKIRRGDSSTDRSRFADAATDARDTLNADDLVAKVIDQHLCISAHAIGATGPAMYYASGMQGASGYFQEQRMAGNPVDHGPALLQLIQTVIHPDFWNVNGGSGRAHYYRAQRVLVVTATMRVHEDMTGLLNRLR